MRDYLFKLIVHFILLIFDVKRFLKMQKYTIVGGFLEIGYDKEKNLMLVLNPPVTFIDIDII
ncbi:hypothetical protein GCM10025777_18540 [Membranihabitans marinus]